MKLKGLKYYILGLISLPIFLTSFSSAFEGTGYWYRTDTNLPNIIGQNSYLINNKGTMFTNDYKFFWLKRNDNSYPSKVLFGWINGQLYYAYSYANNITPEIQGTIDYFCVSDNINDWCSNYNYSATDFYNSNRNFTKFFFRAAYSDPLLIGNHGFYIAFYDGSNYYWAGVSPDGQYPGVVVNTGNSINLTRLDLEYLEGLNVWGNSPFSSSSNDICIGSGCDFGYDTGDSQVIIWSGHTGLNKNYMDLFHTIGFYSGLCYSDFYLNNLVNSGTNFNDFFITDLDDSESYTGATVFDLWPNWFTSNLNFATYFNNANAVYKTVYNNNDRLSIYDGLSKGQFRLFFKLNNAEFIDTYTLNSSDVYSFCSMVINGYDSNSIFTGFTSISFDNIKSNSDYIQENGTDFVLSGANDSGLFSGGSDLLDVFNKLYSRFKQAFPVDERLSSNTVGILPPYIILGFFIFLLLYILKR